LAGLVFGLLKVGQEWKADLRPVIDINLSPWALPGYTFLSLSRGLIAYAFSLGFTLVYGYWAAKDRAAERVLVPLLDILQSIPVLGFMPGLVLGLVALFPRSNIGLELAAVLMIFTGQVWNMTFSFYHSVHSMPEQLKEVASLYRFSWWQRLKWVELPYATMGLVWNSMMSMAGGWFFLMINEAFVLGGKDFRLPGVGAYMSVAVAKGDYVAMCWAILAMVTMILVLDQLLWRPIVVWAQRFRLEDTANVEVAESWFLNILRRSVLVDRAMAALGRLIGPPAQRQVQPEKTVVATTRNPMITWLISRVIFVALIIVLLMGAAELAGLLWNLPIHRWGEILLASSVTLGRVLISIVLGTLWTVPVGLAIGLSPRLSRVLQPVVQVLASFPAPMLFPAVMVMLHFFGIPLNWGCILLMLLGTQWYILFNVIAGAMAVPSDLREAARAYRLNRVQLFWRFYLPAIFPYLVTGWITAAGGTWNASVVAEYVTFRDHIFMAFGLGSQIGQAAEKGDYPSLGASILIMSILVVVFNRYVWKRLYALAEKRFTLNK
jgi:NitT/TauT family transport system permease protein